MYLELMADMYRNRLDLPHHKDHLIIHRTNHIEYSYNEVYFIQAKKECNDEIN